MAVWARAMGEHRQQRENGLLPHVLESIGLRSTLARMLEKETRESVHTAKGQASEQHARRVHKGDGPQG